MKTLKMVTAILSVGLSVTPKSFGMEEDAFEKAAKILPATQSPCPISKLAFENLVLIFKYLDGKDLASCAKVCKLFSQASRAHWFSEVITPALCSAVKACRENRPLITQYQLTQLNNALFSAVAQPNNVNEKMAEIVRLVKNGADVNSLCDKKSLIEYAYKNNQPADAKKIIQILLGLGASWKFNEDMNSSFYAMVKKLCTRSYGAAQQGNGEELEKCFTTFKILDIAHINLKNGAGQTLLHVAARRGHKDLVVRLLELGADVNSLNNNGKTPLDLANYYKQKEVSSLLLQHGGFSGFNVGGLLLQLPSELLLTIKDHLSPTDIYRLSIVCKDKENENEENVNPIKDFASSCKKYDAENIKQIFENGKLPSLILNLVNQKQKALSPDEQKELADDQKKLNHLLNRLMNEELNPTEWLKENTKIYAASSLKSYREILKSIKSMIQHSNYNEYEIMAFIIDHARQGNLRIDFHTFESLSKKDLEKKLVISLLIGLGFGVDISSEEAEELNDDHWIKVTAGKINALINTISAFSAETQNNDDLETINSIIRELYNNNIVVADLKIRSCNLFQIAVNKNSTALAKLLLGYGAYIDVKDSNFDTPLMYAVNNGCLELVKFFVENGADVNSQNLDKETPLFISARNGRSDICSFLLKKGANPSIASINGISPLACAALSGHKGIIAIILDHDLTCLDGVDEWENTPLHFASTHNYFKNTEAATFLINKGIDVNKKNKFGTTALHQAARCGNADLVQKLINRGAKVDEQDELKQTALHYAAKKNDLVIIDQLIKAKADINALDDKEHSPLIKAILKGNHLICQMLIVAGADLKVTYEGHDLLYLPINLEHNKIFDTILTKLTQKEINSLDSEGFAPLHYAILLEKVNFVKKLLVAGANPTLKISGDSCLEWAAITGNIEIIELIINNLTSNEILDSAPKAILLAKDKNHTDAANYIKEKLDLLSQEKLPQ